MDIEFDYAATVLGNKIAELTNDRCGDHQLRARCAIRDKQIRQLQQALRVFTMGQGYLTRNSPKQIVFFNEMLKQ